MWKPLQADSNLPWKASSYRTRSYASEEKGSQFSQQNEKLQAACSKYLHHQRKQGKLKPVDAWETNIYSNSGQIWNIDWFKFPWSSCQFRQPTYLQHLLIDCAMKTRKKGHGFTRSKVPVGSSTRFTISWWSYFTPFTLNWYQRTTINHLQFKIHQSPLSLPIFIFIFTPGIWKEIKATKRITYRGYCHKVKLRRFTHFATSKYGKHTGHIR